MDKAMQKH